MHQDGTFGYERHIFTRNPCKEEASKCLPKKKEASKSHIQKN